LQEKGKLLLCSLERQKKVQEKKKKKKKKELVGVKKICCWVGVQIYVLTGMTLL